MCLIQSSTEAFFGFFPKGFAFSDRKSPISALAAALLTWMSLAIQQTAPGTLTGSSPELLHFHPSNKIEKLIKNRNKKREKNKKPKQFDTEDLEKLRKQFQSMLDLQQESTLDVTVVIFSPQ